MKLVQIFFKKQKREENKKKEKKNVCELLTLAKKNFVYNFLFNFFFIIQKYAMRPELCFLLSEQIKI